MIVVPGSRLPPSKTKLQLEVLQIIKSARESLNPQPIIERLSDDAVYESQHAYKPIVGKDAIAQYLTERFDFISGLGAKQSTGLMTLATVDLPVAADHPCLIFEAEGTRQALWVAQLSRDGLIERIDILTAVPSPLTATPI